LDRKSFNLKGENMSYMVKHRYKGIVQGFFKGLFLFHPFDSIKGLGIWKFETEKEAEDFCKKFFNFRVLKSGEIVEEQIGIVLPYDEKLNTYLKGTDYERNLEENIK
jgi:hypothetical protein